MNAISQILKPLNGTLLKSLIRLNIRRCIANVSEESSRQNELFIAEQKRQRQLVGRVEKIDVFYEGPPENSTLVMNKNLSTPYDCATHLGDSVREKAVIALLNNETLWHLHRPLPDSCKLELLHYHVYNPSLVNKAFWRSCSFILGAVVTNAFKDNVDVKLHSFPSPNVKTGSFIYDVQLSLDDWKPTLAELKVLSTDMIKFCQEEHAIECLDVSTEFAFEIFKSNPHKTQQIPDIAAHNSNRIRLFKVGSHIDISRGPMIPNTNHLGRITIANVLKLNTDISGDPIYRFQGVALPKTIILNHFSYSLLEDRARTLNSGKIPGSQDIDNEDNSFVARVTN